MTIARDKTGAVVGQVTEVRAYAPTAKNIRAGLPMRSGDWSAHPQFITLLQRGRYVTVPRSSVRLEELR